MKYKINNSLFTFEDTFGTTIGLREYREHHNILDEQQDCKGHKIE